MINSNNIDSVPSIADLRKSGYKVRVSHFRNVLGGPTGFGGNYLNLERITKTGKKNREYNKILELGGETHVELTNRDGKTFNASARCSDKEQFNRRLGNHICLARLQKQGAF